MRICQSLRDKKDKLPIILILEQDKSVAKDTADVILNLPFTVQKLSNRIKPLLPGDGKDVIQAGPIRLDTEKRACIAWAKTPSSHRAWSHCCKS